MQITNAYGLASPPNRLLSYEHPTIESIEPDYIFRGVDADDRLDVVINGTGFGIGLGSIDEVLIGDANCSSIVWRSRT